MLKKEKIKPNRKEYIQLAIDNINFQRRKEVVYLKNSVGRVSASDVYSLNTLPNTPTSSMDGIAFRYEDIQGEKVDFKGWKEGEEYVFSNTGVAIPINYDTVVPIERVECKDGKLVHITTYPKNKGQSVNAPGDMMNEGDLLLPKGCFITPYNLGVLAAGGIKELEVLAKPKVSIIPTGDELISSGLPVPLGKNIETNSIVLEALINEWGGEAIIYPIIPDDPEQLYRVLCQAVEQSDVIIFNAGTSKGTKDYAISVLERVGEILVYQVAHGPAKPTTLTIAKGKPILGLVGPPNGAELTASWYLRAMINHYLQKPQVQPKLLKVKLLESAQSPMPFDFYFQIMVTKTEDGYEGKRVQGRAKVTLDANAILEVPYGVKYEVGDLVDVELKVPMEYIKIKEVL